MDIRPISLRIAEINATLTEMKRAYFVDGITTPASERVTLEAELASLKLKKLQIDIAHKKRDMQVRQLRGALMKERLVELGHPNLHAECNAQAEQEIAPMYAPA